MNSRKDTPFPRLTDGRTDNLTSCTSTGCVLQLCKVSSESVQALRRSCAYKHMDRQTDAGQTDGWTGKILLHAHPQVVYCNCVKFHLNRSSRLGAVVLTRIWTDGRTDRENLPSCTSSGCVLQLCKVWSESVKPLRRSCTYKTYGQTDGQGKSSFMHIPRLFTATV